MILGFSVRLVWTEAIHLEATPEEVESVLLALIAPVETLCQSLVRLEHIR